MRRLSSPFLRGGNLRDSLGTTLNGLLERIDATERRAIREAVRAEALERGVVYFDDDNQPRATPLLLRPRVLGGNQRAYLHRVTRVLEHAYMKLLALWDQLPAVREILPLTEAEERWMRELHTPHQVEVFFGRFDASTDFGSHDWIKSTQFFEFNPLGAGGTYLAPTVDDIILRHVAPALARVAPTLLLEPNDDPRRVMLEVMADHARHLRLKRFNLALCQYKGLDGGVEEFPRNVEFFRALGIQAWHVDPRELCVVSGELTFGDHPIDIVYRDHEINDLASKEAAGDDLSGMRHALRTNRCISSLAGEFDHKSVFEVFTTPALSEHFTALERRVFRQHLPWTRRVLSRRTTDPDGAEIDLVPWLSTQRARTVLKPNRSYGGEGILLGRDLSDAEFTSALERALASPGAWVAQAYSPVAEKDFPVIDEQGGLALAEYFSVLGLFASEQRLGILGRASRKKVVNVALDGGLVAVLRLL
ncbi:MAG TPA: hypothetical protein VK843_03680 [Planctomycetota bacterium]|nr:hypothetical protein [Planctomycetota bacterium]